METLTPRALLALVCSLWLSWHAQAENWLDTVGATAQSPGQTVVLAVIDSGLDYAHPHLPASRIWRHGTETANGRDDDGNGFIDDLIGWDFVDNDNNPWDSLGHGTFVAGLVAAEPTATQAFRGLTANVQIMPLRVLNSGGYGTPHAVFQAMRYAIEQGAKVVNLSLGQAGVLGIERWLLAYALENDVVVVIAAGNGGVDASSFGPAGAGRAVVVGAIGHEGQRAGFSNTGSAVTLVAPGVELTSLRARQTDFNLVMGVPDYEPGTGFQGEQAQLYVADGTSFAAPIVAAAAAEIRAQRPQLSALEVIRVLEQSARDIDLPGRDWQTGYGVLDLAAALVADEDRFIHAEIHRVEVVTQAGRPAISVIGQAAADRFKGAELEVAKAGSTRWQRVAKVSATDGKGTLGSIAASELSGSSAWQIRLTVRHRDGSERVNLFELQLN